MLSSTQKKNLKTAIDEIVKNGLELSDSKTEELEKLVALDGFNIGVYPFTNNDDEEIGKGITYERDAGKYDTVEIQLRYEIDEKKIYLNFYDCNLYMYSNAQVKLIDYFNDDEYDKEYDVGDLSSVIDIIINDLDEYLDILKDIPEDDFEIFSIREMLRYFDEKYTEESIQNMSIDDYLDGFSDMLKILYDSRYNYTEYNEKLLSRVSLDYAHPLEVFRYIDENSYKNYKKDKELEIAWNPKLGNTYEEVFEKAKRDLLIIRAAAKKGDLDAIEKVECFNDRHFKWRIAFIFQDLDNIKILSAGSLNGGLFDTTTRKKISEKLGLPLDSTFATICRKVTKDKSLNLEQMIEELKKLFGNFTPSLKRIKMLNSTQKENLKKVISEIVKNGFELSDRKTKNLEKLVALDGFDVDIILWDDETSRAIRYARDVDECNVIFIHLGYKVDDEEIWLWFGNCYFMYSNAQLNYCHDDEYEYEKKYDVSDLSSIIDTIVDDVDEYLGIYKSIPEDDFEPFSIREMLKYFDEKYTEESIQDMSMDDYLDEFSEMLKVLYDPRYNHDTKYNEKLLNKVSLDYAHPLEVFRYKGEKSYKDYSKDSEVKIAWNPKLGDSYEEVFEKVKRDLLIIRAAAKSGDVDAIEKVECFEDRSFKWRIAFIFQDLDDIKILSSGLEKGGLFDKNVRKKVSKKLGLPLDSTFATICKAITKDKSLNLEQMAGTLEKLFS